MKLRSEKDIELYVKEVRKIRENDYLRLSDLDTRKDSTINELKRVKYRDLENMLYGLQLTYDEIIDILGGKNIAGSTRGYTLPPGVYEIIDINLMLKSLFP